MKSPFCNKAKTLFTTIIIFIFTPSICCAHDPDGIKQIIYVTGLIGAIFIWIFVFIKYNQYSNQEDKGYRFELKGMIGILVFTALIILLILILIIS